MPVTEADTMVANVYHTILDSGARNGFVIEDIALAMIERCHPITPITHHCVIKDTVGVQKDCAGTPCRWRELMETRTIMAMKMFADFLISSPPGHACKRGDIAKQTKTMTRQKIERDDMTTKVCGTP
mmetsp:Transcript_17882/g.43749  ORF Transcript_17882/g.43749 Transcript_17882/m.43749 type:complete len:127 (+) Transcript_17882:2459-2839(+)